MKPIGRVPRVARLLALAHRIDGMIRAKELRDWAEAARLIGITRARMTQIANLLLLAPKFQEKILHFPHIPEGWDPIAENELRRILVHAEWRHQVDARLGLNLNRLPKLLPNHAD